MKNYKFLLKTIFFIFNLLFATWLVIKIEGIAPSDFGPHKRVFDPAPIPRVVTIKDKDFLKSLAVDFKYGRMDSLTLDRKITEYLLVPEEKEKDKELSSK